MFRSMYIIIYNYFLLLNLDVNQYKQNISVVISMHLPAQRTNVMAVHTLHKSSMKMSKTKSWDVTAAEG